MVVGKDPGQQTLLLEIYGQETAGSDTLVLACGLSCGITVEHRSILETIMDGLVADARLPLLFSSSGPIALVLGILAQRGKHPSKDEPERATQTPTAEIQSAELPRTVEKLEQHLDELEQKVETLVTKA